MKKLSTKKYLVIGVMALLAIGLLAASSGVALAQSNGSGPPVTIPTPTSIPPNISASQAAALTTQTPSSFNCTILGSNPCAGIVTYLLTVTQATMGLLIIIAGWIITIGMALTTTVYSSQATQSGFAATLSIANLAFILAIIVIAIATILRRETYGYKKTLWRLVAMAILVNFGLVITAPIVGFANGMTNYFVASVGQGTSGANAVASFSNNLMQKTNAGSLQGTVPTNTSATGGISVAGAVFQTLFSLIFIIIFDSLIAITFLSLGILLFVRYIFLVVLLVLLPLAWVTWIFPNFSHQSSEWWKKFIQWTFFPPAAMFFVWLAMTINLSFANTINTGNSPGAAISNAIGQSVSVTGGTNATSVLAQMVNSIVVIGIMIGGLLAASKLAGGAGAFAVTQAKNVSGAVTGYVGRRTKQTAKRYGTAALRTEPVKNLASRLQQRSDNAILRGTGLNWLGRKVGQGAESIAVAGGSKNVDASAERFKKMTPDQRRNRLSGVEWENAPAQRMALLKQVMEDKNLKKLSSNEMERYFGKEQENTFKRFGQEKLYKDLREKSGLGLSDLDKEIETMKEVQPLTAADTDKLADKESEKVKMVAAYIRENPDDVVDVFTDPKKLDEKREKAKKAGYVPAALEEESLNRMQRNITEGIANGLSPEVVSTLVKEVSKKNNLAPFEAAIRRHNNDAIRLQMEANNRILNWNDKQFNRGALDINLREVYELRRASTNPNGQPGSRPNTNPPNPDSTLPPTARP